ncbi:isopentenyl-diphosphate Delta-isomerase [Roseovarius faecimaris]|uniref:Isopentenyl-diphosphate Delta-isomerase n=1 Tax=Roseovarius faecimaris TaxID=2494550 RepID=A0A6I6IWG4_9RHOB|nr:isopentenyl-diphosphate Delta-isomerase [Roseovarius faecimaris]QGX99991.1 isopentenyl-diphosphate Delta-isomerase [Roseovarius faecimaris]
MPDTTPPQTIPAWLGTNLIAMDKIEVHRRGLLHKAVSVFVLCDDHLLIQRRALGKYHTPGLWANTCCTHPHWREDPDSCARRRLEEELGLTGLTLEHREQIKYRADVGGGMTENELVDIFVSRVEAQIDPNPNPEEVMQTEWISLQALKERVATEPETFTPWLRIYLDRHAEQIFDF